MVVHRSSRPSSAAFVPHIALTPSPRPSSATSLIRASTAAPRPPPTRRAVLATTLALLLSPFLPAPSRAAPASITAAREALNACDAKITGAKWDGVRTLIVSAPLVNIKKTIVETAKELPDDLRGPYTGVGEDLLTALKLLDGAVYGNVFIGEDRQILGTKIDFDTPRVYLRDAKDALDTMIEMADSG